MAKKREENNGFWKRISISRIIIVFLLVMILFAMISIFGIFSLIVAGPVPTGNIAVVPITGMISAGKGIYSTDTSADWVIDTLDEINEDDSIKAVIIEINSGGGSAVASDEIAQAVNEFGKPTVAVIREAGASGAYWIASASDKVYANRMSITGSIGVIASYLEFANLLEDYNISYRRLVSGDHKDMGSPLKEMTSEEEKMFQSYIDEIHNYFVEAVAENRNIPEQDVIDIATGKIVLGQEALELGLIDELGSMNDAVAYLEDELGIEAELAEYRKMPSFFDFMAAASSGKMNCISHAIEESSDFSIKT